MHGVDGDLYVTTFAGDENDLGTILRLDAGTPLQGQNCVSGEASIML